MDNQDDRLNLALEQLREKKPLIPDELAAKFDYCTSNASKYVMENFVVDNTTPERAYRSAMLQLYQKIQTQTDLYYSESKRERDIERKRIKIESLQDRIDGRAGDPLDTYERRTMELDIQDLEEEILQIEDQRRLTRPLLRDSHMEVEFYLGKLAELEGQLRPFEEAEQDFFHKKLEYDIKVEHLSGRLGLSRSVVEQLLKVQPIQMEALVDPMVHKLLPSPEPKQTSVGLELPPKPELHIMFIMNRDSGVVTNPDELMVPDGYWVSWQQVPNQGSPEDTCLKALDLANMKPTEYGHNLYLILDCDVLLEESALVKLVEEIKRQNVGAVTALCPRKWGDGSRTKDLLSLMLFKAGDAHAARELLRAALANPPVEAPCDLAVWVTPLNTARVDIDTGKFWKSSIDFTHPLLTSLSSTRR